MQQHAQPAFEPELNCREASQVTTPGGVIFIVHVRQQRLIFLCSEFMVVNKMLLTRYLKMKYFTGLREEIEIKFQCTVHVNLKGTTMFHHRYCQVTVFGNKIFIRQGLKIRVTF